MLHVIFTADGIPGHISHDARHDSEEVMPLPEWGDPITFLASHRRVDGRWLQRLPVEVLSPSPEEIAAKIEADYQAVLADRAETVRVALVVEADPLFFKWQRDECTREDWLAKVDEIKARYPKPERPKQGEDKWA